MVFGDVLGTCGMVYRGWWQDLSPHSSSQALWETLSPVTQISKAKPAYSTKQHLWMQSLKKDGSGYTAALGGNSSLTHHFSRQNTSCFHPHIRRHLGSAGAAPGFAFNLGYKPPGWCHSPRPGTVSTPVTCGFSWSGFRHRTGSPLHWLVCIVWFSLANWELEGPDEDLKSSRSPITGPAAPLPPSLSQFVVLSTRLRNIWEQWKQRRHFEDKRFLRTICSWTYRCAPIFHSHWHQFSSTKRQWPWEHRAFLDPWEPGSGDRLSLVIILILEEQQFNLRCERQSVNERNDISALHDTKMFMVSNLGKFYFIIWKKNTS